MILMSNSCIVLYLGYVILAADTAIFSFVCDIKIYHPIRYRCMNGLRSDASDITFRVFAA